MGGGLRRGAGGIGLCPHAVHRRPAGGPGTAAAGQRALWADHCAGAALLHPPVGVPVPVCHGGKAQAGAGRHGGGGDGKHGAGRAACGGVPLGTGGRGGGHRRQPAGGGRAPAGLLRAAEQQPAAAGPVPL